MQKSMDDFKGYFNVLDMFFHRVSQNGDAPFLWHKHDGQWISRSWKETALQVSMLAKALKNMGLQPGDRVMLVSENRPEWCIADLAIMAAGCITVPTYTTNTERDHQHIMEDSGARAVIVSTKKLSSVLLPCVFNASKMRFVITMEEWCASQASRYELFQWNKLIAAPDSEREAALAEISSESKKLTRDDIACIIYTSGTGGVPRGVMQHHGALLHNAKGTTQVIHEDFGWGDEVFLSFLPLSHAYEHSAGQITPIGLSAQIFYAEGLEKLATNIEEVRPTIMVVVPRLFEVLRTRIMRQIEKQGKAATKLLNMALKLGEKDLDGRLGLLDKPKILLANKTIIPKVQAKFGGRVKALVSGGAPLNPDIGIFFHALGLTLLQGYGQTEAGPVIACNRPAAGIKMDTVGPPMPDTEVKIAEDGEILARGELVMKGYWNNEEATARTVIDGWLHTGDIGHIDEAGRVVITDRKKDMIVNDKGDNVSPQKLEGMLTLQPEISQAMIYGDNRPHMTALIVPDPEWALIWSREQDMPFEFDALQQNPQFRAAIKGAIDRVNKQLSVIEKIRQFTFADEPFAIENEQMTPSMKIRRHVIKGVYEDRLTSLYKK